MECGKWHGPLD
jgi:hypothetical protein